MMKWTVFVLTVVAAMVVSAAWPYNGDNDYSSWRLARSSRRSHHCVGSGSKCFSTGECCRGFVCAAFDDYFGMNPEIPGFCVIEKDLQPCYTSRDCETGSKCTSLGREGETYCIKRPETAADDVMEDLPIISVPSASQLLQSGNGGLGASCKYSSDCKPYDNVTGSKLCCQNIRMGRMGKKSKCERVKTASKCITN